MHQQFQDRKRQRRSRQGQETSEAGTKGKQNNALARRLRSADEQGNIKMNFKKKIANLSVFPDDGVLGDQGSPLGKLVEGLHALVLDAEGVANGTLADGSIAGYEEISYFGITEEQDQNNEAEGLRIGWSQLHRNATRGAFKSQIDKMIQEKKIGRIDEAGRPWERAVKYAWGHRWWPSQRSHAGKSSRPK